MLKDESFNKIMTVIVTPLLLAITGYFTRSTVEEVRNMKQDVVELLQRQAVFNSEVTHIKEDMMFLKDQIKSNAQEIEKIKDGIRTNKK